MKWLQDNPLGMALTAISGVFTLLALGMTIVWNLPVAVETFETGTEDNHGNETVLAAHQVAAINTFQVINEKPVFNESRLPVIDETDENNGTEPPGIITVKDAPDVRLTGIIITPSMKIASLTPANGQLESVMAHEGQALIGEFVGWHVSKVNPRTVVLKSSDGQEMELNLQVHDVKIKKPPESAVPAITARAGSGQDKQVTAEGEQPLSRAEQIRQRIAERREELRREQEEQQAQDGGQPAAGSKTNNYQSAIRAMMKNNSKDKSSNDKKDG